MQKQDFSVIGVVLTFYGVITLYYFGYKLINLGDQKC